MTAQNDPSYPFDPAAAARATARVLIDIEAVHCDPDKPFILTSGRASPVYIDCRKIISFPAERRIVIGHALRLIESAIGRDRIDVVAGGETAGIPYAAWISDGLDKPMVYVRKKPKGFGRMAQIEGDLRDGSRALLVEDLATDGGSKIRFCKALREAGASVEHAFVVFHYGIFPAGAANVAALGLTLHALATWRDVLAEATAGKDFAPRALDQIRAYIDDPEGWSLAHGGKTPDASGG